MRFKYKKLILTASGSIMLLGMVIFSTRNSLNTNAADKPAVASNKTDTTSATGIVSNTVNGEAASTDAIDTEKTDNTGNTDNADKTDNAKGVSLLMKNAYPEVNKLIGDYFKARIEVDKDKIAQLVDDVHYAGLDDLPMIVKNIESINLLDCYTIDGPEEKAMMVYARNEVKFKGIDTPASSLDGFYVRPDNTGDLKIVLSPVSNEVQKIIDEDTKREDVGALLSDVNTKFAHEIKSDKKLADFYGKLKNRQAGSDENIEISDNKGDNTSAEDKDSKKNDKKSSKSSSDKKSKAKKSKKSN